MADIDDKFGKASIETNYALATTVKTARTVGESVLACYDLSRFSQSTPVFFVTYKKTTDPVTDEVSVTNQTSWKALVNPDNNTLTNLTLAPGYEDIGNDIGDFVECIPTSFWGNELIEGIEVHANPDGTLKVTAIKDSLGNDGRLVDTLNEATTDFVLSGGVWATVAGLNSGMTALAAYINGYKNTVAAVATRAFTPSKDTYVDVLHNTGTNAFSLVYTEVANGAASPALAANSIRIAKIVTSAVAITSTTQIGRDSLKNTIYPNGIIGGGSINTSELMGNILFQPSTVGHNVGAQGTNYNLGPGTGASVTFTVEKACVALVTVNIAMRSTSDYEFRPQIFLDGVFNRNFGYPSANSNGGRSIQRGGTAPVILTAGTHTISAGVFISSATNPSCDTDGVNVCVLVLGKVIG